MPSTPEPATGPDPHAPTIATFAAVVGARRMIRAFVDDPIDPEVADSLVDLGRRGPSAGNSQSLHLLSLTEGSVGEYWDVTLPRARRASFPWPGLLRAPLLVVPYVEPARYVARYAESDKVHTGLGEEPERWPVPYWWVDGGAAVQTILLGVAAHGLGACFFGQFEHEAAVRTAFGVPDSMRALGTLAIGHPDPAADRPSASAHRGRRPWAETVHRNRW